jgi:hypothetical protein
MLRKDRQKEGQTDGSVTISLCNFAGEGIIMVYVLCVALVKLKFVSRLTRLSEASYDLWILITPLISSNSSSRRDEN